MLQETKGLIGLVMRGLAGRPVFVLSMVILTTLTIGLSSVILGLYGLLTFRDLPYPQASSVFSLSVKLSDGSARGNNLVIAAAWERALSQIGSVGIDVRSQRRVRIGEYEGSRVVTSVSGSYFPLLGETDHFRGVDDELIAVISSELLQREFQGSSPLALRSMLEIDKKRYRIVGVAGSTFTSPASLRGRSDDIWIPFTQAQRSPAQVRGINSNTQFLVKLPRGALDIGLLETTATAALKKIVAEEAAGFEKSGLVNLALTIQPLREAIVGESASASTILLVAGLLTIAFGSTFVGTIWVGHLLEKASTLSLVVNLGGTTLTVARILVIELVLLLASSLFAGIYVSSLLGNLIRAAWIQQLARAREIEWRASEPAAVAAVLFGVLAVCGLIYIARFIRETASVGLGKGTVSGFSASSGIRSFVFAIQIFVALLTMHLSATVLADAGQRLLRDSGYRTKEALYLQIYLPAEIRTAAASKFMRDHLVDKLSSLNTKASEVRMPPVTTNLVLETVSATNGRDAGQMNLNEVGALYFDGLGIGLESGRYIDAEDLEQNRKIVVLSHAAAKAIEAVSNGPLVGKFILIGKVPHQVVGVVRDIYDPIRTKLGSQLRIYVPFEYVDGPGNLSFLLFPPDGARRLSVKDVMAMLPSSGGGSANVETLTYLDDMRSDLLSLHRAKVKVTILILVSVIAMVAVGIYFSVQATIRAGQQRIGLIAALGGSQRKIRSECVRIQRRGFILALPLYVATAIFGYDLFLRDIPSAFYWQSCMVSVLVALIVVEGAGYISSVRSFLGDGLERYIIGR